MDIRPQMQTHRLEVGGHDVSVDGYGSAGPAVLLHGIPGWRGTWKSVAPFLAQEFQVYAPDLLGFGESDDPVGDFHAKGQAKMLLGLMNELNLAQAHLVGFDFGGPVALHLYKLAPQRIRSLTLSNTNLLVQRGINKPAVLGHRRYGGFLLRLFFGRF